ncbi:MAG: DUF6588 family protein [Bacteroidales bacterium]
MKQLVVITALLFLGFSSQKSFSQLNEMGKLLTGGKDDAQELVDAYLSPFTNAFGATLNAGWYNTARPHRTLGFDLTLSVNVALIPDDAKSFNISNMGLNGQSDRNITPTIAGAKDLEPAMMSYDLGGNDLVQYTLPQGTGLGFIPAPTLQLGIGIPLDTEIIGRFIPQVDLGDVGNLGLWGIGIKHSLKQWIPVVSRLPVVNLSVMAGYTKFYTRADLNFQPADINALDNTTMAVNFDDQNLDFGVGSFTANIIASADVPFVTGYLGLGINSTNTNLKMTGWYPVPEVNAQTNQNEVTDDSALQDPIDYRLTGDSGGIQPRVTAGAKLKLAVFHIHFDYTYASYSVVTGGVGISFR